MTREGTSPLGEYDGSGYALPRHRTLWGDAAWRFSRNRVAMVALLLILLIMAAAVLAPLIDRQGPTDPDYPRAKESPSADHWFGTDLLGRDQWSRVVHGARISLSVGLLSQAVAMPIGLAVGMAAGLGGRTTDNLAMRLTDIAYAFPDLLLLILLLSVLGPSFVMIFLAIGLVGWPTLARLVRAQVLSLKEREFVLAARAIGAPPWRIACVHLIPNLLGPVLVMTIFGIPFAIFAEAGLAYIGLGLAPPEVSWGRLVTDGHEALRSYPHLVFFPAAVIAVTMVCFTFVGDGLRDALDPRVSGELPFKTTAD